MIWLDGIQRNKEGVPRKELFMGDQLVKIADTCVDDSSPRGVRRR